MWLSVGRKSSKVPKGTIWPSYHQKMKGLALMVTEIWSGNEMHDFKWNFKMATFLGVQSEGEKNWPAHFHPEPTIKIWWSLTQPFRSYAMVRTRTHTQPTVRNNMVLSFLLHRSATIMIVDIWIRDYNPPRCFKKKISGRGKHNGKNLFWINLLKKYMIVFYILVDNLSFKVGEPRRPGNNLRKHWSLNLYSPCF
jgi:hypothetical protein